MHKKERLRLALAIISGRRKTLDARHWALMGYDTYKFRTLSEPSENSLKRKAEEIIFDAILDKEA